MWMWTGGLAVVLELRASRCWRHTGRRNATCTQKLGSCARDWPAKIVSPCAFERCGAACDLFAVTPRSSVLLCLEKHRVRRQLVSNGAAETVQLRCIDMYHTSACVGFVANATPPPPATAAAATPPPPPPPAIENLRNAVAHVFPVEFLFGEGMKLWTTSRRRYWTRAAFRRRFRRTQKSLRMSTPFSSPEVSRTVHTAIRQTVAAEFRMIQQPPIVSTMKNRTRTRTSTCILHARRQTTRHNMKNRTRTSTSTCTQPDDTIAAARLPPQPKNSEYNTHTHTHRDRQTGRNTKRMFAQMFGTLHAPSPAWMSILTCMLALNASKASERPAHLVTVSASPGTEPASSSASMPLASARKIGDAGMMLMR